MGANGDIVRGIYQAFAKGDVAAVLGTFDPGIVWNEAEGYRFARGQSLRRSRSHPARTSSCRSSRRWTGSW